MHQSFTGNARKTRQVNLSGRSAVNPWATLPNSTKPSHGPPAAQSTVAQAQAERLRRQQDRERTIASRKLQQTWRGYAVRRSQKSLWRQEWDAQERRRLCTNQSVPYQDVLQPSTEVPPYENQDFLLQQLQLLVRFQEFRRGTVRNDLDTVRLLYFGKALKASHQGTEIPVFDERWTSNLSNLGLMTARHIYSAMATQHIPDSGETLRQLCQIVAYLSTLIPKEMNRYSVLYLQSLLQLLSPSQEETTTQEAINTILAILSSSSHSPVTTYGVFATEMLSDDRLAGNDSALRRLAAELDLLLLIDAVIHRISLQQANNVNAVGDDRDLWQLSYLISFRQHGQNITSNHKSESAYIHAVSLLLGSCANTIAEQFDVDNVTNSKNTAHKSSLPSFVHDNISLLPQQDTVKSAISVLTQPQFGNGEEQNDFYAAKVLANYAVAMLRAFPTRATNIRMWLYQGSVTLASGKDLSIIQFFWAIASTTTVFKRITQSQRNVLSVLREAAPETNQIGRLPVSNEEIEQWREEWRIILLFFELYSFVLRLMDDEDFFSQAKSEKFGFDESATSQFRKSALPLADIATMTTFLKNLAFTLYWNVADLTDANDVEESGGIAALFSASDSLRQHNRSAERKKQQTLAGNGVSQIYLKDLATGMLRMLHERDSRRRFLSDNHWLMTSQVEMAGFIPAVTAEEEKRHELIEDEADDEEVDFDQQADDQSGSYDNPGPLLRSMFGIREPHLPRSMTSRHAERLEQQRLQSKRKRQLELLAPRIEILRNLPFFIPFETRVQIFREFVYRDQIHRRGGYVDPDNWRMSIASTTQGRGLDGRPRGFDLISRQHAEIHRESVFEDAYASFYELGDSLKEPIQISFIDKFGAPEAGIDGGGVTKEFLMSVTSEAFDPKADLSMFQENEQRFLYPNPVVFEETTEYLKLAGYKPGSENFTYHMREFLRRFEFIGRVVGKCLYEGILIDVNFAGFFLLKWALTGGSTSASSETAYRATINDLRDYDDELYQGLLKLKNYPGDVEADFSLNFTISDNLRINDGHKGETVKTVTRDLMLNGSNVSVTNLNRPAYIDRVVRYRLQEQPRLVTNAFLKGLSQIIQPSWLAMFNQKELQKLVGGDNTELDIADLRRNTLYGGLYVIGDDGLEHPTVELFWRVLKEMDDSDRRKVLKFVTSTPRAPLLGFSHLNPKFSIRDSSEDQERLPSTSTCVNLLKLPRYGDVKTMRDKLLYAVNSGAGFDLS